MLVSSHLMSRDGPDRADHPLVIGKAASDLPIPARTSSCGPVPSIVRCTSAALRRPNPRPLLGGLHRPDRERFPGGDRTHGRPGRRDRLRRHRDHRDGQRRGGKAGRRPWCIALVRAHPCPGLAGGGVHGTDPETAWSTRRPPGRPDDRRHDRRTGLDRPGRPSAQATFGDVRRSEVDQVPARSDRRLGR